MKKRLLAILIAFVVLTSFVPPIDSVQASTHTHNYNIFAGLTTIGDGYITSGHYFKTTSYWFCSCGEKYIYTERKLVSHNKVLTNNHHGTLHTYGDSCTTCGWSNIKTYSCSGGNGGICIYPY